MTIHRLSPNGTVCTERRNTAGLRHRGFHFSGQSGEIEGSCTSVRSQNATHNTRPFPNLDSRELGGYGESSVSFDERVTVIARIQIHGVANLVLYAQQIKAIGPQAGLPQKARLSRKPYSSPDCEETYQKVRGPAVGEILLTAQRGVGVVAPIPINPGEFKQRAPAGDQRAMRGWSPHLVRSSSRYSVPCR